MDLTDVQRHKKIKNWTVNKSKEIGLKLDKYLSKDDVFNEAFIIHKEKNIDIFLAITKVLHDEKYKINAKIQRGRPVSRDYEKKCNRCLITKNQAEFYHLHKKQYCINYLSRYCIDCTKKWQNENRNKRYAEDVAYREKCKQRQKQLLIDGKIKPLTKEQKKSKCEKQKARHAIKMQNPEYRKMVNERKRLNYKAKKQKLFL